MWREYRTELPKGGLHGPFAVGSYSDGMAQIGLGFPSPRHRGSGLAAGFAGGSPSSGRRMLVALAC